MNLSRHGSGTAPHPLAEWAYSRPFTFALLMTVLQVLLGGFVLFLAPAVLPGWDPVKLRMVATALMALIAALLLQRFGLWREARFNGPAAWRNPWVGLVALGLCFVPLVVGFKLPPNEELLTMTWRMVVNSFAEEAIFRGLALAVLLPRGPIKAALITSALFGSLHFMRLMFGADLGPTAMQVVSSTLFGLLMAALWLRTGTIWWPILVHTAANIVPSMATPTETEGVALGLGITLVSLAYSLFLLWRAAAGRQRAEQTPQHGPA